jgi:hypothetical protein
MSKLIFTYTDKEFVEANREASKIEFEVPDDMNINEYKIVCVRLAAALGYSDKSIKKSFGDLVLGDENINELKDLLNELNIKKNNKEITK